METRRIYYAENWVYRWAHNGEKAITMHCNAGILQRGRNGRLETNVEFELVEGRDPETRNEAVIQASCGQTQKIDLTNIDENQTISEVTIRGVKYTPSNSSEL